MHAFTIEVIGSVIPTAMVQKPGAQALLPETPLHPPWVAQTSQICHDACEMSHPDTEHHQQS